MNTSRFVPNLRIGFPPPPGSVAGHWQRFWRYAADEPRRYTETGPALLVGTLLLSFSIASGAAHAGEKIDPKNPPQGRFSDEWVEIYLGEGKIGYGRSTMTREGDRMETRSDMHMRLGRADAPVKIDVEQFTTESVDGVPIRFGSVMDASAMKTSTIGTVADGRVTLTTSQFGMEQKQAFELPSGSLMTWGIYREGMLRGFRPGTTYTLKVYAPELRMDAPVEAITKIGEREDFEHRGKTMRGQRVTVTMTAPAGTLEMVSWVDGEGTPLKAKVPAAGIGDMIMIATDQQTAMADFVPPEVFMTTTLPAGRKIDRARTDRIVYRIFGKPRRDKDVDLKDFPNTDMQKVTIRPDGSAEVVVARQPLRPLGDARSRISDKELAEFLDDNLMINTKDPQLIDLAKKAAEGEKDPYRLADKLRRFVTEYITSKNMNIGFATASEVCRNREGDCSEHGVLLAALGRINGLPSRVAVGLAYVPLFGNAGDLFGYHLWTQFYIDGRWIDVDAALRESEVSPARLVFATSSLKNTGMVDISLPLLNKIGAIGMEIVTVDERP